MRERDAYQSDFPLHTAHVVMHGHESQRLSPEQLSGCGVIPDGEGVQSLYRREQLPVPRLEWCGIHVSTTPSQSFKFRIRHYAFVRNYYDPAPQVLQPPTGPHETV